MDESNNISKSQWILIGVIAIGLIYYVGSEKTTSKTNTPFENLLKETANEINKSCQSMVDKDTRLDNAIALPGNILQYNYTLVTLSKAELNLEYIKETFEPKIINSVKTNPDLKIFRANKTTMVYNYNDKEGTFVYRITVTPDLYN